MKTREKSPDPVLLEKFTDVMKYRADHPEDAMSIWVVTRRQATSEIAYVAAASEAQAKIPLTDPEAVTATKVADKELRLGEILELAAWREAQK